MNLKEAIELIDPEIEKDLELMEHYMVADFFKAFLKGRLSQMKREVEFLKKSNVLEDEKQTGRIKQRIEALNILINHLEEVLK